MIRRFEKFMMKEHTGKDNAITSRELEAIFHCKGTKIRETVNELRCRGTPICSCGTGYYYSEAAEDIHETIAPYHTHLGILSFGYMLSPVESSAQHHSTSELLRTL